MSVTRTINAIGFKAKCDPMGRLIIATARHLAMPVVTSDRKITACADAGFLRVIPCRTGNLAPAPHSV
jgi:PIN domain nuclease of toxin-antitoxin system